jgi:GNAT superfamily N-acetyltransferase
VSGDEALATVPGPTSSGYAVEQAGAEALADLARMRLAWSADQGLHATDGAALEDFGERMRRWWDQQSGHRRAWVARTEVGDAVGMANAAVFERMPKPAVPPSRWAYVANVWVDPAHRRRGVGGLLMGALVGWARAEGMVRVVLAPSEVSRPLYSAFGFREAADSLLRLEL